MAQIEIPLFNFSRGRTRTYDAPSANTEGLVIAISALLMPAGTFIPTALTDQPEGGGWLLCDGREVSKSEFPRLYDILKGRVAETEGSFSLPDLRGRMMMGASGALEVGAFAGADQVSLTVNQMPPHAHAVTDTGHDHGFTVTPHTHGVTDPGHAHAVTDPGHAHGAVQVGGTEDAKSDSEVATVKAGGTTLTNTTGLAVNPATAGVAVNPATAGGTIETAQTGVTVQSSGGGQAIDIVPPVMGINWLVRA